MGTYRIQIDGLVQGVGFQTIYLQACRQLLICPVALKTGTMAVFIFVNCGPDDLLKLFLGKYKKPGPLPF